MTARASQFITSYATIDDYTTSVEDVVTMPRVGQKRKSGGEIEAALSFADRYCETNGIPCDVGTSLAERECHRVANEAREQFKSERDSDPTSTTDDLPDRNGLTPAQKYSIRLRNNRKSANAARVFSEVLKRKQSDYLRSVPSSTQDNTLHLQSIIKSQKKEINDLKNETQRYKMEIDSKEGSVVYEKSRNKHLEEKVRQLTMKVEAYEQQAKIVQNDTVSGPNQSQDEFEDTKQDHNRPYKQEIQPSQSQPSQSVPIHYSNPMPCLASQPLTQTPQNSQHHLDSQLQNDSQNQQENIPPSSGSQGMYYRLSSARYSSGYNPSWSDLPLSMRNDSDGKEFHTGLTCSQSQNEDTPEDKGTLMRAAIPMHSIALLGSQQSQELPFKGFSSDDLGMPPDSELFGGSQGTSKGRNS